MSTSSMEEQAAAMETADRAEEKKVRVQLDFEQGDMRIINELVAELGLGTRAELFRSGVRALRWMAEKKRQKCSLFALTPDGRYLEPEFDFLERASTGAAAFRDSPRGRRIRPRAESPRGKEATHA